MTQHDNPTVKDATPHQASPEATTRLQSDAVSQVGDKSNLAAWSKMGAGSGQGDSHAGMNAGGAGKSEGAGGSLDFSQHGNIYDSANLNRHAGLGGGAKGGDGPPPPSGGPAGTAGGGADLAGAGKGADHTGAAHGMGSGGASDLGAGCRGAESSLGAHTAGHATTGDLGGAAQASDHGSTAHGLGAGGGADLGAGAGSGAHEGGLSAGAAGGVSDLSAAAKAGDHSINAAGGGTSDFAGRSDASLGGANGRPMDHAAGGSSAASDGSFAPPATGSDMGGSAYTGNDQGKNTTFDASPNHQPGALTGDGGSAPSDSAKASSRPDGGTDANAKPGAGADNAEPFKATDTVPFNSQTATYDGKQMYELSPSDRLNLPESTLAKVNQNNVTNLEGRVANLGDKMPDVVFRGVGDKHAPNLEALANNQNPSTRDARDFAIAKDIPSDPGQRLSDMAGNYNKARSYADAQGDQGRLYAFAHNRDMQNPKMSEVLQKEHQKFAPAPFAESKNAGELGIPLNTDRLSHITTLNAQDIAHPDAMTPMAVSRSEHLTTYDTAKNLDKVMSKIEAPHADFLRGVQAQNEARDKAQAAETQARAQAAQDSSVWSRMSDTLKSWF